MKPPPPMPGRERLDDAERGGGRDGRVDGVAAVAEHVDGRLGGQRVDRGGSAAGADRGRRLRRQRRCRTCRPERPRGRRGERPRRGRQGSCASHTLPGRESVGSPLYPRGARRKRAASAPRRVPFRGAGATHGRFVRPNDTDEPGVPTWPSPRRRPASPAATGVARQHGIGRWASTSARSAAALAGRITCARRASTYKGREIVQPQTA